MRRGREVTVCHAHAIEGGGDEAEDRGGVWQSDGGNW